MQAQLDDMEDKRNDLHEEFSDIKHKIARDATNSRTGKRIPPSLIREKELEDRRRDEPVVYCDCD